MNTYEDLTLEKLFRLDGEVAFVTGGGDGFGPVSYTHLTLPTILRV